MNLRRITLALLGLLLFGAVKLPFEHGLSTEFHAAHFLQGALTHDVREQTGQMGFVAALSGFRSVVGDFVWLDAYTAWTETNYGKLKFLLDTATSLQPRNTLFWDTASWHMAWNATVYELENEAQPRETLRIKAAREYIRLGEAYLLRGLEFNPDSAKLYERLGNLYQQKMDDHCRAAASFFESAKHPGAMSYVRRAGAYELVKCPGHEAEALQILQALYREGPKERLPTLLKLLNQLQTEQNVPAAERIDVSHDLEEATPRSNPASAVPASGTPAAAPPAHDR